MTAWISEAAALETQKQGCRPVVLFRMTGPTIIRAWTGVGDYDPFGPFETKTDDIEIDEGAIYKGVGQISSIPVLENLINGIAARLVLGTSGVDMAILVQAQASVADIAGETVNIGLQFLGSDEQAVAPPFWPLEGVADELTCDWGLAQRKLSLSVGFGETDRRRPRFSFYSAADQTAISADDDFCAQVARYDPGSTITWPKWTQ